MTPLEIVLVDDEPKPMISKRIKLLGHSLQDFRQLDEALAYVRNNSWKIDLMLIDEVFKNTTEDSKIKSGLELGRHVANSFDFIPMVMLTVNSDDRETASKAYRDSGFIDFFGKGEWAINYIPENLNRIIDSKHFKEKIKKRRESKKQELLKWFAKLNKGQRKQLKAALYSEGQGKNGNIQIGSSEVNTKDLLKGWVDVDYLTEKEICEVIGDLLHATDRNILFQGEWSTYVVKDGEKTPKLSYTRTLLEEYETSKNYKDRRHSIDFDSINYILEVIGIERIFNPQTEKKLKKNFITELTFECVPKKPEESKSYFKQKMIGRRVAIAHKRLLYTNGAKLTLLNLLMLFKLNKTGTYSWVSDVREVKSIKYSFIPSSCHPSQLLNTALGLSYVSTPINVKEKTRQSTLSSEYEERKSAKQEKIEGFEYYLQDTPEYLLFEEAEWYRNIGQYAELIYDFLQEFKLPKGISAHHTLTEYDDLNDFNRMINMVKLKKNDDYVKLLNKIIKELDAKDPALVPAMEYLLKIDLNRIP